MSDPKPPEPIDAARRDVLKGSAAIGAATLLGKVVPGQAATGDAGSEASGTEGNPQIVHVTLNVNDTQHALALDSRTTLLDALRDQLHLTGTKKGCDHGQCGACTVLIGGRRVNSCLTLAVMHQDEPVKTIEGFGTPDHLHPLQAAFVEHDGFQCGYCTPGQICSAAGMLAEFRDHSASFVTEDLNARPELTDMEIRERMSGNICRCAAYPNIVAAIKDAKDAV